MSIEFPGMPERSWGNFDGWAGSWHQGSGWSMAAPGGASRVGARGAGGARRAGTGGLRRQPGGC